MQMKYLHKHGIIHRDFKPENILVDENFYLHICDFGLSRCFEKSLSNSIKMAMTGGVGTPIYMAPVITTRPVLMFMLMRCWHTKLSHEKCHFMKLAIQFRQLRSV